MKTPHLLRCAIVSAALLAFGGCATNTTETGSTTSPTIISNASWRLTQLGDVPIETAENGREIQFTLEYTNKRIVGDAGCNRFFGRYEMNGDAIRFSDIGSTKMFCEGRMEAEQGFLSMLGEVASWKISDGAMQLLDANGNVLASFEQATVS